MKNRKRYIQCVILACVVQFSIILSAHQIMLSIFRSSQADQFVIQTRNFILIGDYRSFDYARNPLLNGDFSSINFCEKISNDQRTIIKKISTAVIIKPITYQANEELKSSLKTKMCFSYNRLNYSSYLIGLWFTSCFVAMLVLNKILKNYEEKHDREIEYNRNKAIVLASKMIAHDLRQPFSTLNMVMKLLKNSSSSDYNETIELIGENVAKTSQQATDLIDDLLNIDGEINIQKKPTDLNALIISTLESVSQSIDIKLPDIKTNTDQTAGILLSLDPNRFSRVLVNLFSNAIQANSGEGIVKVATALESEWAIFKIYNSEAQNLTDEDIKNLFKPFFSKGKKGGTGLGLAVVENIVRLHGGSINAMKLDSGLEFSIFLPRI